MPNEALHQNTKFSALVAYFKKLASEHVSIQHSDENKRFFRFELDEVLTGLPAGIRYPAFVLEGYRFNFEDAQSNNPFKNREGAFILLDHVSDPGDYDKIHQVWEALEIIGDDIIARIVNDKRDKESPVMDFKIQTVSAHLVGTDFGNHYGLRYTFEVSNYFPFTVNQTKWLNTNIGSD